MGGGNEMFLVKQWDWGLRFESVNWQYEDIHTVTFQMTAPGLTAAHLRNAVNQGWYFGVRIQKTLGPKKHTNIGFPVTPPPPGVPPTITIGAPANGALVAQSNVPVSGAIVSGNKPVTITVNDIWAYITGQYVGYYRTLTLADGPHTIPVRAGNDWGHVRQDVTVTVDTVPPAVSITAPANGSTTTAASVTVVGTATDATSGVASVVVNGVPATLAGSSFSAVVPLALGANEIISTAVDLAGNASVSGPANVERGTAPTIGIATPGQSFATAAVEVVVTGAVSGSEPLAVVVNGVAASVTAGSFSATVPLALGANTITATATNPFGSASASASGTRTQTGAPLSVTIDAPPDGAAVSSRVVAVSGRVSDGTAAVTVNGATAIVTGRQYVAPVVELVEGANALVAVATRGGDVAQAQAMITYNAPPRVVITEPSDGERLRVASTDVEGVVDDLAAYVDVNGVVARVGPGGRFVAPDVPLVLGENPLLARAIDPSGAMGSDEVRVTRDDAALPALRLVFTSLERYPFFVDAETEPSPLIAEDAVAFRASLDSLGFAGDEFQPPIESIQYGYGDHVVFVFAEESGDVDFYENDVFLDGPYPLAPIEDLPNDFLFQFAGLDPAVIPELLPVDFEARYYATLDRSVFGDGSAVAGDSVLRAAATNGGIAELSSTTDLDLPSVAILSPADGSTLASGSVGLTGTAADTGHLFERVRYAILDQDFVEIATGSAPLVAGRFTIPELPLGTGPHCVVVTAFDAAGNNEGAITCLTIDPNAPAVQPVSPRDGEAVLSGSVSVDLNFTQAATLVSVNGVPDGRSFSAGIASDAVTLPLALGPNVVTLVVDAGSGAMSQSFTIFRVESVEPIRIVDPADGALRNTTAVSVSVRAPRGTPSVDVNGVATSLGADGVTFSASIPLVEGENVLTAVARPFGQRASTRVVRDSIPPRLLLVVPEDGARVVDAEGELTGLVSEPSDVRLLSAVFDRRTDTTAHLVSRGDPLLGIPDFFEHLFELGDFPFVEGANTFTLRLTDRAGNVTDVPLSISRAAAALALVDPLPGSAVAELVADLRFEAFADVTIDAVYVAGRRLPSFEGLPVATGFFTLQNAALQPGPNELRVVYHRADGAPEVLLTSLTSTAAGAATVTGTVTDAKTGLPLSGALVTVKVGDVEIVVVAGDDGSFVAIVPPGAFTLSVRREGFQPLGTAGTVASGETLAVVAPLLPWTTGVAIVTGLPSGTPASRVAGTVTDWSSQTPLDGVLVTATASGVTRSAITGPGGQYAVEDVPVGPFQVAFTRVGYFPQSFEIADSVAVSATIDPSLESLTNATTLIGTVTSGLTGEPEPGVSARLLGTENAAVTDEQGRFVLFGVPLGPQSLRFEKSGFVDDFYTLNVVALPEGYPLEVAFTYPNATGFGGTIAIAPNARGTVRDSLSDAPIPGAEVRAGALTTVADAEGNFTLDGLTPLTQIDVVATAPGHDAQTITALVVVNGEDTLHFGLRSQVFGAIEGTIRDATTNEPVAFASVRVRGASMLGAATNREGLFEIAGIAPGTYTLDVVQPEYAPASVSDLVVTALATTTANATLVHRPTTGRLAGRITDAGTGAPVAGASLAFSPSIGSTTDAQGRYQLGPVPAGLVSIAISASGYAPTTRTLAATADLDVSTARTTTADFALTADGGAPDSVTQPVSGVEGGFITTPDGRMTVIFPPLALTEDARVTLRAPEAPPISAGALLNLDPAFGAVDVKAIGEGVEIVIEAAIEGEVAPRIVGPVAMVARYRGEEIASGNIAEDTLFPYYFDGTQWTAMRMVPYFHAVDRVNELVLTAMSFTETETGSAIFAELTTDRPVLLADASGGTPPLSPVRKFVFWLAGKVAQLQPPGQPVADFQDLGRLSPFADGIHPNALPLLVVHGWDPSSILFDSGLPSIPDSAGRYTGFIEDLLNEATAPGGKSVYRPVFLRYNSRLAIRDNAQALAAKLRGRFYAEDADAIRGVSNPENPDSGRFSAVNAFGFSMGGLVSRAYACRSGHVRDLVTVGTPHVGALQSLVRGIERYADPVFGLLFFPEDVRIRDVLAAWSPGTADLLPDGESTPNPTLATMNALPCYGPSHEIQLVGGTDEKSLRSFFPEFDGATAQDVIDEAQTDPEVNGLLSTLREIGRSTLSLLESLGLSDFLSVGSLAVGEHPNDGIVPLRSAYAQTRSGSTVPALAGRVHATEDEDFNHLDLGKPGQRLANFTRESIFPAFTDWKVATILEFEPPTLPTSTEPGEAEVTLSIDYSVRRGDIKSIAIVWYGKDSNDEWHILKGADPESLKPNGPTDLEGSSSRQEGEPQEVRGEVTIPAVDPDDPTTNIDAVTFLVVDIYSDETTVPEDPTEVAFGLPEVPSSP